MSDAILVLRLEHRNIRTVLEILGRQLDQLERDERPDFHLLESALIYLTDYTDECHHPKEELIYRKLQVREPHAAEALAGLEGEHEELARLTRRMLSQAELARERSAQPLDLVASALGQFLDYYRQHMAMEEKHLFRAAPRFLTEDDWAAIDFDLFDRADPVFDQEVEARFGRLHEGLAELAGQEERFKEKANLMLLSDDEAEWLHGLTTLADFNAHQKESGVGAELIRFAGGGYGLMLPGEQLAIDIPECSTQRAVWCAYYFLRGQTLSATPTPSSS